MEGKKFGRLRIKYLYTLRRHPHDWANWHGEANIGDAIQCLAVESLYKEMGITPDKLALVDRDSIDRYDGETCLVPLQGWFGYFADVFPFPWSERIAPFFSGFHLTPTWSSRERFVAAGIPERMRPFQPIGCRDRGTMYFLRSLGLNAYFSGCLTLAFPKRDSDPKDGKTFLVDLEEETKKLIPRAIMDQVDESITHYHYFSSYPVDDNGALDFEIKARSILQRYRVEAKLIITSRLHAVLPCLALGIPVVFIADRGDDERFDALKGLLPIYKPEDMGKINWNPPKPDVEELKKLTKQLFFRHFREAAERCGLPLPDFQGDDAESKAEAYEKAINRLEACDLWIKSRQIEQLEWKINMVKDEIGKLRINSLFLKMTDLAERKIGYGRGIRQSLKALREMSKKL
jgi:citrate lyase gamma subunit